MIKLKNILKESKYAWDREFGDPLPTFKDIAETHQNKPIKEMTSKTKRDMENSFETSEDLDDFITKHQSEIPKNQWRKIDNYLDDIRDEEQGMKSSGWADPAKKGLKKILTRYIKESAEQITEEKLPQLKVPSDVSYYNRDWGKVFDKWGDHYHHYGPSESHMYDWNDRSHYDNVVKEYNAHMKKVAAKLNAAAKPLEDAYKVWHKILDKHRNKDRS